MKRPIKFRGTVPQDYHYYGGDTVFGSLMIYAESEPANQGYTHWIYPLGAYRSYPVDADSVAQLVGYDKNGNEVYEGDILVTEVGHCKPPMNEYTVEFKVHGRKHGASVTFKTETNRDVLKEVKT